MTLNSVGGGGKKRKQLKISKKIWLHFLNKTKKHFILGVGRIIKFSNLFTITFPKKIIVTISLAISIFNCTYFFQLQLQILLVQKIFLKVIS